MLQYHFCAARREKSNGFCFRSLRPIVIELWPKICISSENDKVQKHKIANISKTVNRTKNCYISFLCGSSRGIQRFLFQVATTNSYRVMTKDVDFVRVRKTQNRKYLENGASYGEKYEQHFCVARREESNGLCFRSIRPILFELWPKYAFRPKMTKSKNTKSQISRKR